MANVRLQPPDSFDFRNPDKWPKWKRRFEQFQSASGLAAEGEPRQVSTILYCLGEDADDVLTSTSISEADRKKYDSVMAKFDAFFKVRKNIIFERARFNQRSQLDGESAEQYITALYRLINFCEYGALKEEMLRDRIVVGIRYVALSKRLQMDADLTPEKAKKQVRQKEAVKEQLHGATKKDPIVLDEVKGHRLPRCETVVLTPQKRRKPHHEEATVQTMW